MILYSPSNGLKINRDNCSIKLTKNTTILDRQLRSIKKAYAGAHITIVNKFQNKKNKITQCGASIIENNLFDTTNCLYSLSLIDIKSPLLIIPGNIVFTEHYIKNFDKSKSSLWIMKEYNDIGCVIQDNKVTNIMFGLHNHWSGIIYLTGKEIKLLKEITSKSFINRWHLFEGINWIIDKGGEFKTIHKTNKIRIINRNKNV